MLNRTTSVYVHIPFCVKKCGYCDFNAYSGYRDSTKARYADALIAEIAARGDKSLRVPTVFFGGGTPTTLPAEILGQILAAVREAFAVDNNAEISVEANPGDASAEYLSALRGAGFNRLSWGVQTFNDRLLRTIDRIHSADDARHAIALAKDAGWENLSLDLMFALPRQTLPDFDRSLDAAFALDVPHISMYALIVEEGTAFGARRDRGTLPLPSEKTEAAMFARAIERTAEAGYRRYEVSNFARPGYECRHNQVYWRNEPYLGFGAGAVSYQGGTRSMNEKLPARYADTVEKLGTATTWSETLTPEETMGETVMVGLRLAGGVDLSRFAARFGVQAETVFATEIARFTENGLLETVDGYLRLTPHGLFLGSDVMGAFLR